MADLELARVNIVYEPSSKLRSSISFIICSSCPDYRPVYEHPISSISPYGFESSLEECYRDASLHWQQHLRQHMRYFLRFKGIKDTFQPSIPVSENPRRIRSHHKPGIGGTPFGTPFSARGY